MEIEEKKAQSEDLLIREWFLLTAVAGGFFLYRLSKVGEASLHSVLLGYSASRLVMMAFLLVCTLTGLAGLFNIGGKFTLFMKVAAKKKAPAAVCTVLFLGLSLAWLIGGFMSEESFRPFFERIEPLLLYGMFVSGSAVLLLFRLKDHPETDSFEAASVRKLATIFFYIAFAVYLFIRVTGIGIVPDEMDWQPNGMVIHYWEIGLSLWIALTAAILLRLAHVRGKQTAVTVLIFFLIWISTAILWVSIPTMKVLAHSYFMEITPPNDLPYPASDAAYYGLWAESILAGLGFKSTVVTRQFLIVLIALFEALTGHDLLKTIDCFTFLLALIPACMYLLGKKLHSHGAGIFAAGMAAFREYNTILLAPHFMVSSSKMLLSDLPGMLCILASLCAAIGWYQKPRSLLRMVLTGCLAGLSVTVRSQSIILIPFLALFFLLNRGLPFRVRILPAAGFMIAALLVIAPWLIRSKVITGDFILDEPGIHSTELARRWSDDPDNIVVQAEDESDAEYAARNTRHMIDFFFEKPFYVLRFTASHFFANQLCALTALPFGTDFHLTIHDYTDTGFHDVEGRMLKTENAPILILFLLPIVLGMSAARNRAGIAGLLPFFLGSIYLLLTAAGRYSGWRFALPADWFCYFYFALGIGETAYQIASALGGKRDLLLSVSAADPSKQPAYPAAVAGILILFLILGAAPALCGRIIPQQIFTQSSGENIRAMETILADHPAEQEQLSGLLSDPENSVISGRIIYPRFFYAHEGLSSGHPWTAYKIRDFSRLGFVLLNQENHDVILPVGETPAFIPNAADIFVIGRENKEGYFLADAVIIPDPETKAAPRIIAAEKQE